MDEKEINLKAEEMNEILSARPPWLFRWGISIIFILILIGIISLYFIETGNISLLNRIIMKFIN